METQAPGIRGGQITTKAGCEISFTATRQLIDHLDSATHGKINEHLCSKYGGREGSVPGSSIIESIIAKSYADLIGKATVRYRDGLDGALASVSAPHEGTSPSFVQEVQGFRADGTHGASFAEILRLGVLANEQASAVHASRAESVKGSGGVRR
jgi:hypothetical protein